MHALQRSRGFTLIELLVVIVLIGLVIASPAQQAVASLPAATMRVAMSRSVTAPTGLLLPSTTGIIPQSLSTIILATSANGVSALQQQGFAVITLVTSLMSDSMSRGCPTIPRGRLPAREPRQSKLNRAKGHAPVHPR